MTQREITRPSDSEVGVKRACGHHTKKPGYCINFPVSISSDPSFAPRGHALPNRAASHLRTGRSYSFSAAQALKTEMANKPTQSDSACPSVAFG